MAPTDRLHYRRVALSDAGFLLQLLNSPGWLENIGDRGVYTLEDARSYISRRILPAYESPGCGPYLAVRTSDGEVLGNVGTYARPGLDSPDFGFAFLPQFHRRGYAYEASVASLAHARAYGHRELLAITLPTNEASIRLLNKLGFRHNGETVRLPDDEDELLLLRLNLHA